MSDNKEPKLQYQDGCSRVHGGLWFTLAHGTYPAFTMPRCEFIPVGVKMADGSIQSRFEEVRRQKLQMLSERRSIHKTDAIPNQEWFDLAGQSLAQS